MRSSSIEFYLTSSAFWLLLAAATIFPQSSLFNIPTSDVLDRAEVYAEADFDGNFRSCQGCRFQSYGFSAVYGVGKKVEVGINGFLTKEGDKFGPIEIQPNIKWQIYANEENGIAFSTGAVAYIPLSKNAGRESLVSVYAVASKQFQGKLAPRITGGAYGIAGSSNEGSKYGSLLGYEQPLHKRITFIADWRSGNNRFGYSAAGLGVTLTKKSFLYTAYYFGNSGPGNNAFGIYYGYSL